MKKILATLTLILAPTFSFAASTVTCEGVTNKTVILFVNGSKIVQMRVQSEGSLPKGFATQLVRIQANTSLYTVSGVGGFLEVQNTALNNQGGWLTFAGQRFDCN